MNMDTSSIENHIAIVTGSFYRPDVEIEAGRLKLAIRSIKIAKELGYKILVGDVGSPTETINALEDAGANVYCMTDVTMGEGRRKSFSEALNYKKPVMAWTEAEKVSYIAQIALTAKPILKGDADLVVPQRISLASYPEFQQQTERMGNGFCKSLTGHNLDLWFGPRTWSADTTEQFTNYDGKLGDRWEAIFIPVLDAINAGKNVISVPVDFTNPADQTAAETGNHEMMIKRMDQLSVICNAIYARHKGLEKI